MSTITIEREMISPEVAEKMLAKNTRNRNKRDKHVKSLARDMASGNWQENADAIRISPSGEVVDGQHRLYAIIESGVTLPLFIARNVNMRAQTTIDVGAKRTFADHLKMMGESNNNVLAAAVRALCLHNTGRGYSSRGNFTPTITELLGVLEANPGIRESVRVAGKKSPGLEFSNSVLAFTHYILSSIDAEDAEYFFTHAMTGTDLTENSPIYRLRQVSLDKQRNNPAADMWTFAIPIIFKAWNKFRDGEECSALRFRRGGANPEKFPTPH